MQLVPREILEELATSQNITEIDSSGFSYPDFVSVYEDCLETRMKDRTQTRQSVFFTTYNDVCDSYLKEKCPPIRFINAGSSRAAFALEGGKCLKVATCEKGIAQNKQEIKTLSQNQDMYSCFSRIYDYDKKGSSLLTECCSKVIDEDFRRAFDIDSYDFALHSVVNMIKRIVDHEFDYTAIRNKLEMNIKSSKRDIVKQGFRKYSDPEQKQFEDQMNQDALEMAECDLKLFENIQGVKKPEFQILKDLLDFFQKYGKDELDIGDLYNDENWGLGIRNGKLVPIVIDAGLSTDIYDEYYA